jgi:hypothetical protein
MVEPLHKNYFSCSGIFFSSTVGLVGGGFIGGEFLLHQIVVSSLFKLNYQKMHQR